MRLKHPGVGIIDVPDGSDMTKVHGAVRRLRALSSTSSDTSTGDANAAPPDSKSPGPGSTATGTSLLPLNKEGKDQSTFLAERFAKKGPLHVIFSSDLPRSLDTAKVIAEASDSAVIATALLHPWRLGPLEGKPEASITPTLKSLAKQYPDTPLAGKAEISTEGGESFNAFKNRVIPTFVLISNVWQLMPQTRVGVVTHSKDIALALATQAKKTDIPEFFKCKTDVGDVFQVTPQNLVKVDMASDDPLPAGMYVIRHGKTDWDK